VNPELLRRFAQASPRALEELRLALAQDDREKSRSALYRLRTQAAALGATEVARFARALDDGLGRVEPAVVTQSLETLAAAIAALARGEGAPPLDSAALAPPAPKETSGEPPEESDTTWTPAVDADMVEPFLEETTQRLESLGGKLLRLESAPHDLDLVRDVMRDLHTIKGSSAFVGLRKLNRLSHRAEDLVIRVRDGALAADRTVIDALLGAGDVMKEILSRAAAGRSIDVDIASAMARLNVSGTFPTAATAPAAAPAEAPTEKKPAQKAESTLRVDFEKLDTMLNLVGELVLGRNAFSTGVGGLSSLGREVEAQRRIARRAGTSASVTAQERKALLRTLADELGRTARVFEETTQDLEGAVLRLHHTSEQLRDQVMKLRMVPIGRVLTKYHRTVRELAYQLGKKARLELVGADTELDKVVVEQLDEPLLHLVRNALDHGVETEAARTAAGKPGEGILRMAAHQRGNQIVLEISDDGAGIDPVKVRRKAEEKHLLPEAELAAQTDAQVLDLIFRPGFSTAAAVSEISGRGVGMDIVRETLARLKGTVEVSSQPGRGATFTLKLPLTLAIIQVLLVRAGGELLALPIDRVSRTLEIPRAEVRRLTDRATFRMETRDGAVDIALMPLGETLGLPGTDEREPDAPLLVVLVELHGERFGLVVDRFEGKREIVIKGMGTILEEVPCAAGATLVGDRVVLIVDVPQAISFGLRARTAPMQKPSASATASASAKKILLVEDSDVIRRSLARMLREAGYDVVEARDGAEALELAGRQKFDLVSTDVQMPNVDGYELTRRLRARPDFRSTPILMVTARAERIDRVRGFDAGVDEYIVKPLDRAELLRAVSRHLREGHADPARP
jgi:chemotaxis protein histidine kinase CheA/ActR/RegA family two-component response regulator